MTKKIVFGVAVMAFAALVMAPAASAACGSIRSASTYNAITGKSVYWQLVGGDAQGTAVGQTWELGNPKQFSTGNCNAIAVGNPTPGFLYFGTGGNPGIGLNLRMESCGSGCPSPNSTLAVFAANATNFSGGGEVGFVLATVAETPAGAVNCDFSTQAHSMVRLPSPTVLVSGPRRGSSVPVSVSVPSVAAGLRGPNAADALAGYRIVSALSVGNPGNDAAKYTPIATIAAPGGVAGSQMALSLDCSDPTNTKDQWVATQLSFEGGSVLSNVVSAPTRVRCAGAMVEPKYKVVPNTKGVGATQK